MPDVYCQFTKHQILQSKTLQATMVLLLLVLAINLLLYQSSKQPAQRVIIIGSLFPPKPMRKMQPNQKHKLSSHQTFRIMDSVDNELNNSQSRFNQSALNAPIAKTEQMAAERSDRIITMVSNQTTNVFTGYQSSNSPLSHTVQGCNIEHDSISRSAKAQNKYKKITINYQVASIRDIGDNSAIAMQVDQHENCTRSITIHLTPNRSFMYCFIAIFVLFLIVILHVALIRR